MKKNVQDFKERLLNNLNSDILKKSPQPLFFRGLPFLNVQEFPENWSGNLLILSAYGLGDTVISLGIQKYFLDFYPDANVILIAHGNWKELLEHSTFPTLYYSEFLNLKDDSMLPAPPFPNIIKDLKKYLRSNLNSYIGFGEIDPPGRFASGDRYTDAILREIGISDPSKIRSFIPLTEDVLQRARKFLMEKKIDPGSYCLIAPEAGAEEREWGYDRFFSLAKEIYLKKGMKSIFVGQKGYPIKESSEIVYCYGLTLPLVCALISMANCFIGNDSGLAHVASGFNLPVLTINFNNDTNVHEIRPRSPYACQIISTVNEMMVNPEVEQVLYSTIQIMESPLGNINPVCFACGNPMRYIIGARSDLLIRQCFCGARKKEYKNSLVTSFVLNELTSSFLLPSSIKHCKQLEEKIKKNGQLNHKLQLEVEFSALNDFIDENADISWSFDSILFFFKRNQFMLEEIQKKIDGKTALFIFTNKSRNLSPFIIDWGGRKMFFYNSDIYMKYFSWGNWVKRSKLIDLVKSDWKSNYWKDFFWTGFSVFFYMRSAKSFLRWQRIFFNLLIKRLLTL